MPKKLLLFLIGAVLAIALIVIANAGKTRDVDGADWSTAVLAEKLESGSAIRLIDVREPHEYAAGHIAEAQLIPLGSIEANLGSLNRSDEIAVICRSGNRSAQAVAILREAGFKRVHNVIGGMLAWQGEVSTEQQKLLQ